MLGKVLLFPLFLIFNKLQKVLNPRESQTHQASNHYLFNFINIPKFREFWDVTIKYPRLRVRAEKKNIYDIYNFHTFTGKTRLLSICQILLAVPLPVTFSFVVEALSIFVRACTRGFLGFGARLV